MASVDDNPGNDSSKKRVAARQISKDDDPDAEDEVSVDGVTFKKAPDAVLAGRRIVKVRRAGGTTAPAPAANPLASIRLVPPPAEAAQPEVDSQVKLHEDTTAPVSGEQSVETVAETVTTVVETVTTVEKTVTVTETVTESVTALDSTKDNVANGETSVVSDAAVVTEKVTTSVGPSGLSSETFQQLSSAKNAFSGSFGTGFSAASSTFGSSTQATSSSTFGFSFASTPSLMGSESAASPFQSSVFGKSNGSGTFQLFGSPAAAAAPTPAAPAPSSITLQEVHVESGEEREKTVFAADGSLFEFLNGGWNERGKGEIKVNVPEDVKRRPRLVMRGKGNLRLLLNANILPDMKITKMDNRGVTFVCANATGDGKVELATYALKLRDATFARDFLAIVEVKKQANTEPRTPETSPKAVDRSSDEVQEDVEAAAASDT